MLERPGRSTLRWEQELLTRPGPVATPFYLCWDSRGRERKPEVRGSDCLGTRVSDPSGRERLLFGARALGPFPEEDDRDATLAQQPPTSGRGILGCCAARPLAPAGCAAEAGNEGPRGLGRRSRDSALYACPRRGAADRALGCAGTPGSRGGRPSPSPTEVRPAARPRLRPDPQAQRGQETCPRSRSK